MLRSRNLLLAVIGGWPRQNVAADIIGLRNFVVGASYCTGGSKTATFSEDTMSGNVAGTHRRLDVGSHELKDPLLEEGKRVRKI